tara:strand:+ start:492 stop:1079 length:588 start_codon:yes stop_codon:yes gene_type:complete
MFNGIIFNTGKIKTIKKNKKSIYIGLENTLNLNKNDLGSSVSCNGVCLTVSKIHKNLVFFYISIETLKRSNFKYSKVNQLINLESSLVYGQKISGHFIQGHVDTIAEVIKIVVIDKSWIVKLKIKEKKLLKLLEEKASISINGVSLTISNVSKNHFSLNIIPHTLKLTNLKKLKINDTVNVELDIFAKYIYKYTV